MPSDNVSLPRKDNVFVGKSSSIVLSRLTGRPDYELAFLPVALEIIERPAAPLPRVIALTICLSCATAIAWAMIGKTDIVANAPGVIVPQGSAKIIQSVATANVDAILVEDGEHVDAGQVLVRLDPVSADAARDKLKADVVASRIDVASLDALMQQIHGSENSPRFAAPVGAETSNIVEASASMQARFAAQQQKLADLAQQIAEKEAEAKESDKTITKLKIDLPMLRSVRDMYVKLYSQKLASRVNLLQSMQHYTDTDQDIEITKARRDQAFASVRSLQRQYATQQAEYTHDVLSDLADARQKLAENEASYGAAVHEAEATELKAPVAGTVQQLSLHSVHGVATAGDRLMVIVPDHQPLIVQAEISNRDIGFIREGQQVQVKVAAFKFTSYGLVPGHVVSISQTSTADDLKTVEVLNDQSTQKQASSKNNSGTEPDLDGGEGSGYVAHVALDKTMIGTETGDAPLRPGMAVTAEILTGKRRVISYILSPIWRYTQDAGRER